MNGREQLAIFLGILLTFNVVGIGYLFKGQRGYSQCNGYYRDNTPTQQQEQQQQQNQNQQQQTQQQATNCETGIGGFVDYRHPGKQLSYEIRYDDPTKWKEFKAFDLPAVEKQLDKETLAPNASRPYFETCLAKYRHAEIEEVRRSLLKWILLEPAVQLNESCKAPPLPDPAKLDCKWPHDHAGFVKKREKPRKLGLAVQYGYEVDVLEMMLSELYDVVDRIFICENMQSHRAYTKPLLWERLKTQPRFARYSDRVVHLVLDDTDAVPPNRRHKLFDEEFNQEHVRFRKVMQWNERHKFFGPDDYIGFGDTDEIPSRNSLQYLHYCDAGHKGPIDFGLWYAFNNVHHTWRSDWPVPGEPYTFGDPTFHLVSELQAKYAAGDYSPTRNRGRSGHHILGGTHASTFPYAPFVLMKIASCTECHGIRLPPENISYEETVDRINNDQVLHEPKVDVRGKDLRGKLGRQEHYPWIVMCNPERYKTWYELRDERLPSKGKGPLHLLMTA